MGSRSTLFLIDILYADEVLDVFLQSLVVGASVFHHISIFASFLLQVADLIVEGEQGSQFRDLRYAVPYILRLLFLL
ncbi:unnamed protein product [Sphagnum balticum]